jgi:HK97 family phage portal protein
VLAGYFGVGQNYAGVAVSEQSAIGLSAFYRGASIISTTIAGLPMRTLRDVDGVRTRTGSFLDAPGGADGPTPFEWKETIIWHLILHGNAYLQHIWNGAGSMVALAPVHPLAVTAEWDDDRPGGKRFTVTQTDGTRRDFDASTMTQIMGPSLDGLRGMSVITVARNSLGTAIAGDRAYRRAA